MTVLVVQHEPTLSRANLQEHCEIVSTHAMAHDLIVFSELSLNGYLLQDKVYEDAYSIEELQPLLDASKPTNVIVGAAIKENHRSYNCALYIEKGEIKHLHKKMHLPNYGMFEESRYFFRGEQIEGIDTLFGKMAMLVCEDLWRAQTFTALSTMQLDLVVVIANSPVRKVNENGDIEALQQWQALLKSCAMLANCMVLFVNRVGFEDGLCFYGGSRLFEADGTLQWELPTLQTCKISKEIASHQHSAQKWLFNID